MATVQRRLSVIVCADVVGYSRLMGADELGTLTALKAHREAIDPLFAEEGGRLVKTTGDGLLLEFPSAFHAVRASLSVQRLMAERNVSVPEDKRLVFRMGVHLGDVIVDDGDIFGDGVNIAARLQEIADPGGICLSQAVHATIHKNIDALFRDGGNKVLKNIAAPVHVYNLALDDSVSPVPIPATPPAVPLLSLIVLPFVNLSGDSRQDYLVDSITDHLTTELARIDSSFVVARNTALSYRGDALDVTEIGRELGVHYAIKGSVRAQPGGLRINTQLIDTETGQHLWIDRFDIAIGDAFAMQRDVVVRLIPPLHSHLLAASGRAPQPAPAVLPQTGAGAPPARGVTMAHPHRGTVVYPRGVVPALNARAAAPTARPAGSPAKSEPRPSPPVVRATSSPEVPSTSPARRTARQPAPFRIPFWVKILVIAIVGGAALAMLGAERRSIVEIVSWMLIAAGSVQMISVFTAGPRRG